MTMLTSPPCPSLFSGSCPYATGMVVSCQPTSLASSVYYFINNTMAIPFTPDSYKV